MQSWQIKAPELEASELKHLDELVSDYGLRFYGGSSIS